MDPAYLGVLVMVGANKKNFKPTVTAIRSATTPSTGARAGSKRVRSRRARPAAREAGPSSAPAPVPVAAV